MATILPLRWSKVPVEGLQSSPRTYKLLGAIQWLRGRSQRRRLDISDGELAGMTGMSIGSVQRALRELERLGMVRRSHANGRRALAILFELAGPRDLEVATPAALDPAGPRIDHARSMHAAPALSACSAGAECIDHARCMHAAPALSACSAGAQHSVDVSLDGRQDDVPSVDPPTTAAGDGTGRDDSLARDPEPEVLAEAGPPPEPEAPSTPAPGPAPAVDPADLAQWEEWLKLPESHPLHRIARNNFARQDEPPPPPPAPIAPVPETLHLGSGPRAQLPPRDQAGVPTSGRYPPDEGYPLAEALRLARALGEPGAGPDDRRRLVEFAARRFRDPKPETAEFWLAGFTKLAPGEVEGLVKEADGKKHPPRWLSAELGKLLRPARGKPPAGSP